MTDINTLNILQGDEIGAKMKRFYSANRTADWRKPTDKYHSQGRHCRVMFRLIEIDERKEMRDLL